MEKPASAVTPASSCCAVVNAKPTPAATGMAAAPSVSAITLATNQGVTVSFPTPHS
jgi:hypothetical protein